jgi:hypothetical protein
LVILGIVLIKNTKGSYILYPTTATFHEAVHQCSLLSATVVFIDNSDEDTFIVKTYLQNLVPTGIWLAIYDFIGNETNVNYYTNQTLRNTNWVSGQPKIKNYCCVIYDKAPINQWNEISCDKKYSVLCETNVTETTTEKSKTTTIYYSTSSRITSTTTSISTTISTTSDATVSKKVTLIERTTTALTTSGSTVSILTSNETTTIEAISSSYAVTTSVLAIVTSNQSTTTALTTSESTVSILTSNKSTTIEAISTSNKVTTSVLAIATSNENSNEISNKKHLC